MVEPTVLMELIKLASEISFSFSDKLMAAREKPWEQLQISLESLEELTKVHTNAITEVTLPIITRGDLLSTSQNYQALIYKSDFPSGYRSARGILRASMELSQFKKKETIDYINEVLKELERFQYAAFMLDRPEYDSYRMGEAFQNAQKLWSFFKGEIRPATDQELENLQKGVFDSFRGSFQSITNSQEQRILPEIIQLKTSDDVAELITVWCKQWQRHVHQVLYGEVGGHHGLYFAISRLKMQKYK